MADEAENSPLLRAEASEVDLHHSSMPNREFNSGYLHDFISEAY